MPKFISCDWGTSALRLRVVDTNDMALLAEVADLPGISATFELWKQSEKQEAERVFFYHSVLTKKIVELEKKLNLSLQDAPLIISGMASSNIGMMELPYKEVPFSTDGHDLYIKKIEATADFKHKSLLISGAKTESDVMRGEETQLTGCLDGDDKEDQLFIFPGTHSKHIRVTNRKITDFKTYMTGEFFELLTKKSILSNAVEESDDLLNTGHLKRFEEGVTNSMHSNILHSAFLVRTNQMFGKLSRKENYCYLSGLLIGTELKELNSMEIPITVAGDKLQAKLYSTALAKLGVHKVIYRDAGKAIIEGHCRIYDLYKSTLTTGQSL